MANAAASGSGPLWRVLGLLEGVKARGSGFEARCPGPSHRRGDKHPSLSVTTGYDGRVLLNCHGGCGPEDVLSAIGLTFGDLFERGQKGGVLRRFRLVDPNGIRPEIHMREDFPDGDKDMWWESHGKRGLNGTKAESLPLYRAPEVTKADPTVAVYLVEGEKAAEALAEHGLLAVATVTGADGTPCAESMAVLKGRHVRIWADNDDKGREHMARIAQMLASLGCVVKWVVWPSDAKGADAWDYFQQGGTVEGVALMVRDRLETPGQPKIVTSQRNGHIDIEIGHAADLLRMELPEIRWAIPGVFPEGVALLAGKTKLGKSWLVLDVCLAVAQGTAAWGRVVATPGDVLYLALEDSQRRLQDRLRTLCGPRSPGRLQYATRWPRADEGGIDALVAWLESHPEARLVVIDTLKKFRPREANTKRLYDTDYEAIAPAAEIAGQRGICIVVIHHSNKLNPEDPVDSVSGTTGLVGAADMIGIFRRERGKIDASLLVTGRDVDEHELAFKRVLDQGLGYAWELVGDAEEERLSQQRRSILDMLELSPGMKPADMYETLDMPRGSVRRLLFHMVHAGQLRMRDGRYYAP